jgi:sortase A
MSLYAYVKKDEPDEVEVFFARLSQFFKKRGVRKTASSLLVIVGIFLIGSGVVPIISYQIRYAPDFSKIYSPISDQERSFLFGASRAQAEENKQDYTLVSSWFADQSSLFNSSDDGLVYYNLSIPKLKIDRAVIHIGGEDLKKSLIQYPETAFPGQFGNTVVFGHSVLPQFFDTENYLTIFSTLYKLRKDDEIYMFYDGVEYRYQVEKLFEVSPNDLSVLEQRFDGKFLTLITCTPPGTYLRRLVVKARLVDY